MELFVCTPPPSLRLTRYERLAGDPREMGFYTINFKVGCRGVLKPATPWCSYRKWLARHNPEWSAGGSLIKVI